MKRKIGILTSGGDCPGLNAAIRGVARAAYELFDAEIIGIRNGSAGIDEYWKKPTHGILDTTIMWADRSPIEKLVDKTMGHMPEELL